MSNIYYEPEDFGLEIIHEMDIGERWEFDKHVIFKDAEGKLYYGRDAGCSCPVPFEDFTGINSLQLIEKEHYQSFIDGIMGLERINMGDKLLLLKQVKKYLV